MPGPRRRSARRLGGRRPGHGRDAPSSVREEHRRLYETIAAADAEAAAACALRHVRHYREEALRLLFDEPGASRSG
ncbi:FCD domain-containing protein [Streptomyces sp. NPDC102402]|uniref:FCD domain-containing protein n=1 Tax=Streptomyces sp. NPDC102402 TaxID=3366169 RepID=UPI00383064C2